MTELEHDGSGPAATGSDDVPANGDQKPPAAKPRRKEKRRSEMRDLTSQMSSMNSMMTSRYGYGGALMNNPSLMTNPYMNNDDDDGMYR